MLSKLFSGIRRRLTGKTRGNAGNPSLQTSGLLQLYIYFLNFATYIPTFIFYKTAELFHFIFIGPPRFLRSLSCVEHDSVIRGHSIRINLYSRPVESPHPGFPSGPSRRCSDVGSSSGPPPPSDSDSQDEYRSLIIETDSSFCSVGSTEYGSVFIYNSN